MRGINLVIGCITALFSSFLLLKSLSTFGKLPSSNFTLIAGMSFGAATTSWLWLAFVKYEGSLTLRHQIFSLISYLAAMALAVFSGALAGTAVYISNHVSGIEVLTTNKFPIILICLCLSGYMSLIYLTRKKLSKQAVA